jgi:hypothetical protein
MGDELDSFSVRALMKYEVFKTILLFDLYPDC